MSRSLFLLGAGTALFFTPGAPGLASTPLSDPIPDPPPLSPAGIRLEPWKRVPNSPGVNRAPRLNLLRQIDDGRIFVNDQRGYLYVIDDGESAPRLYLNIATHVSSFSWITAEASQTGFTYFAFHPEFAANGTFYTVKSVRAGSGTPDFTGKRPIPGESETSLQPSHHDVVLRWTADDPAAPVFAGSVSEVLRVEQPYSDHNMGEIAFNPLVGPGDPDYGMLYIATADGGWVFKRVSPDPQRVAQDLTSPLGKILRIDPEGSGSATGRYAVPEDNPFAGDSGTLPEIWAYGLRNPHRINWDPFTGFLFAYDIGGDYIEEINRIVPGGNYGWSKREGTFLHKEERVYALPPDDAGFLYPVAQYAHAGRNGAISGGFVYRGSRIPELFGHLVYADFTNRNEAFHSPVSLLRGLGPVETLPVFSLGVFDAQGNRTTLGGIIRGQSGQRTDLRVGQDQEGELYFLNKHNGWIYQVMPGPEPFRPVLSLEEVVVRPGENTFSVDVGFEGREGLWSVEWGDPAIALDGPAFGTGAATLQFSVNTTDPDFAAEVRVNGQPISIRIVDGPLAKRQSWYYDPDNGWLWLDTDYFPYVWFAEYKSWFRLGAGQ